MKDKTGDSEIEKLTQENTQLWAEVARLRQYEVNDLINYPYCKYDRLRFNIENVSARLRHLMSDLACIKRQVIEVRREHYEKHSD